MISDHYGLEATILIILIDVIMIGDNLIHCIKICLLNNVKPPRTPELMIVIYLSVNITILISHRCHATLTVLIAFNCL